MDFEIESFEKTGEEFKTNYFPSEFKFLEDHNGFRKGELHVLLGPKGGGKSSLFRSMLVDVLNQNTKVFLHLSEEEKTKYLYGVYNLYKAAKKTPEQITSLMKNIYCQSEVEKTLDDPEEFFSMTELLVRETESQILFFDNFTTSFLSNRGISNEAKYAMRLRKMAKDLNIPIVVAIHTAKGTILEKGISGEDVRGNATITNTASYLYTISVFFNGANTKSFLQTDKARYHSKSNKRYYELKYDQNGAFYYGDEKTSRSYVFETIAEIEKSKRGVSNANGFRRSKSKLD